MKKKRIVALFTALCIATYPVTLKISKDKSKQLSEEVNGYIKTFQSDDFDIAAHRGFSSLKVENTEESITFAATKDYIDYIEIDARITKDGNILLSHDEKIRKENHDKVNITDAEKKEIASSTFCYNTNLFDFKTTDLGERSFIKQRKKKLDDKKYNVIGLLEGIEACDDKKILLDLKFEDNIYSFVNTLKNELKDVDTSNIIFQSSDLEGIKYLEENSNYNCLALIDHSWDLKEIDNFKNIGIRKNLVNHDLVEKLINENKKVSVWTINNSNELNRVTDKLNELYKDVIYITDYPDLITTKLHVKEKTKNIY